MLTNHSEARHWNNYITGPRYNSQAR